MSFLLSLSDSFIILSSASVFVNSFFTFFDIFCILFSGIIFFPYNTYSTADFSLASSSGVFFPHNTCLTTQSQLYKYPDACEISLTFISTDIGTFSNFYITKIWRCIRFLLHQFFLQLLQPHLPQLLPHAYQTVSE